MKRVVSFVLFFGVFVIVSTGTTANASDWYPSPTGIRGPIRDAGRPWLQGTPYEPPSARHHRSQKNSVTSTYLADVWYLGENRTYYWMYESSYGVYWYYFPSTGTFAR